MIKKIAIGIVALIAAVLLFAAMRPASFRIERSLDIKAPPERIFALVNALYQWRQWSPWENIDPDMQRIFGGEFEGKGEIYEWHGNDKVGQGRMEIVDSVAPSRIVLKLDFLKPFEAHNMAQFDFVPVAGGTRVTWAMYGPSPYLARLAGLFKNIDGRVGKDLAAGLANLKAVAEKPAPIPDVPITSP